VDLSLDGLALNLNGKDLAPNRSGGSQVERDMYT